MFKCWSDNDDYGGQDWPLAPHDDGSEQQQGEGSVRPPRSWSSPARKTEVPLLWTPPWVWDDLCIFAVSGLPEHCIFFHFPPFVRHGHDISTFLDNLMVWTTKTIYFLNAHHLGWSSWPPGSPGPPGQTGSPGSPGPPDLWSSQPIKSQCSPVQSSRVQYSPVEPSTVQYSPLQSTAAHYSQVQPSKAKYSPV